MKRMWALAGLILIVLAAAVGSYVAFAGGLFVRPAAALVADTAAPSAPAEIANGSAAAAVAAAQTIEGTIVADARVVPVESADLSMSASGVVDEVLVREGQTVKAGDLLLRLDAAKQQVAVIQAQAALQRAQARLDELNAGAREQEIAAAQAGLAAAIARRDRVANGAMPGQIAQAEAALSGSNATLSRLYEGPEESARVAARAELFSAEALLTQAQRAYDLVSSRSDIGALPQSAQLQQATIAWEAAQARLDLLEAGPTNAQIAGASAEVRLQRASLDTLQNTLPSDLRAAEADVAFNQAQLDLITAGARPEQITSAEADVASATAALQQALVALADTELRAPFDGTVALINVELGEQVVPASPVATVANLGAWKIETEDLTELDAVYVRPGTIVQLTFDALPDLIMEGIVQYIRPRGGDNRGDIVYTAVVTPETQDDRLLWNMTSVVTVE